MPQSHHQAHSQVCTAQTEEGASAGDCAAAFPEQGAAALLGAGSGSGRKEGKRIRPLLISTPFTTQANVFKAKNVAEQLSKLTVVAEKPEFNPLKLIKKNEIFLTNIGISNPFNLETFIEDELNRDRQCQQVITFCDSVGAFARPRLEIKSLL